MALVLIFWGHKCFLDPFNADLLAHAVNHLAASMARALSVLHGYVAGVKKRRFLAIFAILLSLPPPPHPQPRKIRTYTIQPRGYPAQPRSSARPDPGVLQSQPGFAGASFRFA